MTDFGVRLKRLRKENDITQATLAEFIGVVPSAVGKYEAVDNAYPSVEALIKIAEFFNVSLDYLLLGVVPAAQTGENNVSGSLSNSNVIQASRGGIVYNGDNGKALSPEATELLRAYESLGGRDRLKLLNYAVELEERSNNE